MTGFSGGKRSGSTILALRAEPNSDLYGRHPRVLVRAAEGFPVL